jgi:hypothetical protein
MKLPIAALSLIAGASLFAWTAPAGASASGKLSSRDRLARQQAMPHVPQGHRPDYYEHLVDKHRIGSSLWWELKRRNVR